jgi:hypothetical protein
MGSDHGRRGGQLRSLHSRHHRRLPRRGHSKCRRHKTFFPSSSPPFWEPSTSVCRCGSLSGGHGQTLANRTKPGFSNLDSAMFIHPMNCIYFVKQPNLKLKTLPKQLLGSPVSFRAPQAGLVFVGKTWDRINNTFFF